MATWPVQDAKARFSEFLQRCLSDGPQTVTRRGKEEAILVSIDDWRRLQPERKPTLKDLLLAPQPRCDLVIPPRGRFRRRPPVEF